MIVGGFNPRGHPFIRGLVTVEQLGVQYEADFLVDTGSDRTHLHYPDVVLAGVDPRPLEEIGVPASFRGAGGSALYIAVSATVGLMDRHLGSAQTYDIDLPVADASQTGLHRQSVLGRDILDQHLMVYDRRADRIELYRH